MSQQDKKIFIAGSNGMVGRAIRRELDDGKYNNLICTSSVELDLIRQSAVDEFYAREKPQIVIIAAAKVGGILANDTYRAEFIYYNLMIEANLIHASFKHGVEKLIFLGSSCIYPKLCPQPMKEEYLLTGPLEQTNEPYAIAKIAGIKLCENYYRQYGCNYISAMPPNLYGANDNFDLKTSHVIPALIRKLHGAKIKSGVSVRLWGTGMPRREFLFVADFAKAIVFLMENVNADELYSEGISHMNIGTGIDISINELAEMIKKIVGYEGTIEFDPTMPDGTPRKLLDTARLENLGWKYSTPLEEGLRQTYDWFLKNASKTTQKHAIDRA